MGPVEFKPIFTKNSLQLFGTMYIAIGRSIKAAGQEHLRCLKPRYITPCSITALQYLTHFSSGTLSRYVLKSPIFFHYLNPTTNASLLSRVSLLGWLTWCATVLFLKKPPMMQCETSKSHTLLSWSNTRGALQLLTLAVEAFVINYNQNNRGIPKINFNYLVPLMGRSYFPNNFILVSSYLKKNKNSMLRAKKKTDQKGT